MLCLGYHFFLYVVLLQWTQVIIIIVEKRKINESEMKMKEMKLWCTNKIQEGRRGDKVRPGGTHVNRFLVTRARKSYLDPSPVSKRNPLARTGTACVGSLLVC